jgi:hypothetical protein
LESFVELHNNLMAEYRKRNWNYVEQAIEHLQGRWKCELDSFYKEMLERVNKLKDIDLPENWNGIVINSLT